MERQEQVAARRSPAEAVRVVGTVVATVLRPEVGRPAAVAGGLTGTIVLLTALVAYAGGRPDGVLIRAVLWAVLAGLLASAVHGILFGASLVRRDREILLIQELADDLSAHRAGRPPGPDAAGRVDRVGQAAAEVAAQAAAEALAAGIAARELVLHFQPIIDIRNARVDGLEALVRWLHPRRGMLPPGEFLPLAEEFGLMPALSRAVLDLTLGQAGAWLAAGWAFGVSVNLSPAWLRSADVVDEVEEALHRHQVAPDLLRFDVVRSRELVDPQDAADLRRLRELGLGLSLDDFGPADSLATLRALPVDQLKIEGRLVRGMATSNDDTALVRTAVELGGMLGLTVVAEGVENTDTLARVVGAGCSMAQGFYFSRPMPAEDVVTWVQQRFPDDPVRLAS